MTKEKNNPLSSVYWADLLMDEFAKESDRAAVILSASLFDIALESLLRAFLVPIPTELDNLFEGVNAPLGTFASRIDLNFRLGLISSRFSRDLHLIRKIRNLFAHNIQGCNFENASVKSRVQELLKSCGFMDRHPHVRKNPIFPEGTRGDFLMVASWMLFCLYEKIRDVKSLDTSSLEWGYTAVFSPSEKKTSPEQNEKASE